MDVFIDLVHIDFGKVGETSRIAERAQSYNRNEQMISGKQVASILFDFAPKLC